MSEAALRHAAEPSPRCVRCGTQLAPALLSCPACRTLVHAARLNELSARAWAAEGTADWNTAAATWEEALKLLPADAAQHATVRSRIAAAAQAGGAAARAVRAEAGHHVHRILLRRGGPALATIGLLAWKFKFVLVFILTKAKLLVLGFSKAGTLLSMLAAFGAYWTLWGWQFALGFVLSIYVHEMGHVAALHHYGIKASAPMFVPGLGAFVRLKQAPRSEWQDAMVGLAGPLWGLLAAVAAFAVFRMTGEAIWGAIARTGAWLNLFNLLPVWQLDGGRGFRPMSRAHRLVAAAALLVATVMSGEQLLLLLALAAFVVAFLEPSKTPDVRALLYYIALVAALAPLAAIRVPVGP